MISDPGRLAQESLDLLRDSANELLLSAVTAWEVAIKSSLGRLDLPGAPSEVVSSWIVRSGVTPLPILHAHALRVAELPLHHRDPFDRLLVVQAQSEGVPIMTADKSFDSYEVEVVVA